MLPARGRRRRTSSCPNIEVQNLLPHRQIPIRKPAYLTKRTTVAKNREAPADMRRPVKRTPAVSAHRTAAEVTRYHLLYATPLPRQVTMAVQQMVSVIRGNCVTTLVIDNLVAMTKPQTKFTDTSLLTSSPPKR